MRARLLWPVSLAALALAALAPGAGAAGWKKPVHAYPGLRIPKVTVTAKEPGRAPGYIFVAPRTTYPDRTGPLMLDGDGRVVWFQQLPPNRVAIGLQAQTYQGRPVLTWGQRPPVRSEGDQYYSPPRLLYNVIADSRYRLLQRLRVRGRGMRTDLHEFVITARNTALMLGYRHMRANLSRYGGPRRGRLIDGIVQEVDIATGRVLLTWSALRKVPLSESNKPAGPGEWDPYHLNSIAEDSDGNLLISARHTSTIYKVDRQTGRVIWKLGGKNSSFDVSRGATFWYQHDAQRTPDGSIMVFDNRSTVLDRRGRGSRAIKLRLDTKAKTATLVKSFRHPGGNVLATSQGNARELEGGNVFVGWGSSPWFSEYSPEGRLLFAARFGSARNQSYRAFKGPWTGVPQGAPAIVADQRGPRVTVYVAWNGATEVRQWRVLGGASKGALAPIGSGPWQDFETKLTFSGSPAYVQVEALDAAGTVLGRSDLVRPK